MKEELKLKKKKLTLIIGIFSMIIILLGTTYAFFTYFKTVDAFTLSSSNIDAIFTSGTNSVTFANAYPISDSFALSNLDKLTYIDFTVSSEVGIASQVVEYEIYLTEEDENTLSSDYVKLYLTDDTNRKIVDPSIYSSLENSTYDESGKVILKDQNPGIFTKNYRLYVWLDSSYEQNEVSQTFKFKVNLYAYNAENERLSYAFTNAIAANTDESCTPYVEEDGIIYLSGTNDCVDFNYVWYSGKLWRITAIYPDGTMKMITDGLMTSIEYGADTNFYTDEENTSYMYQWLNEDFLDTLYNYENIIVTDAPWNASPGDGTISSKLPIEGQEEVLVNASVGLLNSYEYYKSYQNTSYGSGYLNIGYYWWLLNRYSTSSSNVWNVHDFGYGYNYSPSNAFGGRPVINLKSTIQLEGGSGTASNPYRIKGDKEDAVANTTLINTRSSGEYVNFNEELYRIVGVENETTKLIKADYVKDGTTILEKKFASTGTFGSSIETGSDDYWDYYLNKTWLKAVDSTYNETNDTSSVLAKGTYYIKLFTGGNYKGTVCTTFSNTTTIEECDKTGIATWTGFVGLPRYGEMFASQTRDYTSSNARTMLLITPYSSRVWYVIGNGSGYYDSPSYTYSGRPTIHLKSEIVIESGNGTKEVPFEVSLP